MIHYMKKLSLTALLAIGCIAQAIPLTPKTALIIEQGDITTCKVAAIVNAANEQLAGGAGVCGAIFNAAGWKALQNACDKNPLISNVRCPVGHARITPSFMLEKNGINHIIHAVGPDCRIIKDPAQQDALLYSAYNCRCSWNHEHSISFYQFSDLCISP